MKKKKLIKKLKREILELKSNKLNKNSLSQIIQNEVYLILDNYKKELDELYLKNRLIILKMVDEKINNF